MPMTLKTPLLLQADKLEELNCKLYEQTGCFAFLKTDRLLMYTAAASAQDAFVVYSVCLYSLYHDYGRQFLRLLLKEDLCPDDTLKQRLPSLRMHVSATERVLRPNFAHAVYDARIRDELIRRITNYYLGGCEIATPVSDWPNYINELSNTHWAYMAKRYVRDADSLYTYLIAWADSWNARSDKASIRTAFANDEQFARAIDYTLCAPLIPESERMQIKYLLDVYDTKSKINYWRKVIREEYACGQINGPNQLYDRLARLIDLAIQPELKSSVDIGAEYDFNISL